MTQEFYRTGTALPGFEIPESATALIFLKIYIRQTIVVFVIAIISILLEYAFRRG